MERSIEKNGLVNLLALLVMGASGFAAARYVNSSAGQVTSLYLGLGLLVAVVSWFQMRLTGRERLEKLEFDELTRSPAGGASLFESREAEVFPARRAREQFEKYFVPVFTLLLFLVQAGGAVLLWRWLRPPAATGLAQPMVGLALFALFGLVLFILGRFAASFARLEGNRLLQPGAGYLLLGAYLSFLVATGLALGQAGFARADFYVAKVLCALLGLIAAETLISLILEIYRPRVKGKEARPLYESRLVSLLGQPEGLVTTAAHTLDYQFGFQVSETWFYRFLEQALGWILLLQCGALLASTCFVIIEPGEQAVLERFGRPVGGGLLGPGPHLKLPWPIDRAYRYRTERVQSFTIGPAAGEPEEQARIVLWAFAHGKEDNFLVANREPAGSPGRLEGADTNNLAAKPSPPVSLLVVSIPVQYQITNLLDWVYNNADPASLFQELASREVVKYLVSADTTEIMSQGRLAATEELRARIQRAADAYQLGARIAFVGLEDIHPPVKVAPDYEKVVSAIQQMIAKTNSAAADAIKTNALAGAEVARILNEATADRAWREANALASAALFTNQVVAWRAAPTVYAERAYLQMFPRAVAGARKYLLLTTNTYDILQLDLQDKIRSDLLESIGAPPPAKTK